MTYTNGFYSINIEFFNISSIIIIWEESFEVTFMEVSLKTAKYEQDSKKTQLVVDLFGPLIDISKIATFQGINLVRYLSEEDIVVHLNRSYPKSESWSTEEVLKCTFESLKNPKLRTQLVDTEILELICRAKLFCDVRVISTVKDEHLFNAAKQLLIDCSEHLLRFINPNIKIEEYMPFTDDDFSREENNGYIPGIVKWCKDNLNFNDLINIPYTIIVDDDDLSNYLAYEIDRGHMCIHEWIGGLRNSDYAIQLKNSLNRRKRVSDLEEVISNLCIEDGSGNSKYIDVTSFSILNGFYVYNKFLREQLSQSIKIIMDVITKQKNKTKPMCIFLAGSPGTGKSFFVESFAREIGAKENFPCASLSGVSEDKYYNAIDSHVKKVYGMEFSNQKASVAFLDEIDTRGDTFRYLMDAMTGKRTDPEGVELKASKTDRVENLVWFFAGSSGLSRSEFISTFKEERKVSDFFDRIHFDLRLPSINDPGQAILTFLSSIKHCWKKENGPNSITKEVLLLFGQVGWSSARQIMTICRIVAARAGNEESHVELSLFEDIIVSTEFKNVYNQIKKTIANGKEERVNIKWGVCYKE